MLPSTVNGILAAIAIPLFGNMQARARIAKAQDGTFTISATGDGTTAQVP
jgi:type II secretory pathway pseudopilin PulG